MLPWGTMSCRFITIFTFSFSLHDCIFLRVSRWRYPHEVKFSQRTVNLTSLTKINKEPNIEIITLKCHWIICHRVYSWGPKKMSSLNDSFTFGIPQKQSQLQTYYLYNLYIWWTYAKRQNGRERLQYRGPKGTFSECCTCAVHSKEVNNFIFTAASECWVQNVDISHHLN